ncbi:MAG: threonine synthase [Clostridiaceae bacterium]|jgi:threonine synthase|nr:threonine synthase [Clostridiaceae bacterium]
MRFYSTRSRQLTATASQAILGGLAPDGGLYVPEYLPSIDFSSWQADSYQEMATKLFGLFLTDFSASAIQRTVEVSYGANFDDPRITPLHRLDENHSVLELWHGPTLAFKDLALQCLPHLFTEARQIQKQEGRFLILTATSGDTGKAAMAGFSGQKDALVAVFYPDRGVSPLQERQMLTDPHSNVAAYAVEGNFDDCQRAIKSLMQDEAFIDQLKRQGIGLSSANSINVGRLLPQMVYYIYAYFNAVQQYGDPLSVVVPSGNLGNILAARYVKEMGLPLADIRLASNSNKVLYDFISTGIYDARRDLMTTSSPSMDILVASNMERYLHLLSGDGALIDDLMRQLKEEGVFRFDAALLDLEASWASEDQVMSTIREVYETYGYLIDPHTAVAIHAREQSGSPLLIAGTASPYKFAESVLAALGRDCPPDLEEQIRAIQELLNAPLPPGMKDLLDGRPREKHLISTSAIPAAIDQLIGANP